MFSKLLPMVLFKPNFSIIEDHTLEFIQAGSALDLG